MPAGAARPVLDLREELRRYLAAYPDAADSLVGIRQWWLPDALQETSIVQIRSALEDLIVSGEVRRERLPDGTELFSRAAQSQPDDAP